MGFSKSGPYSAEEPLPERQFPDLMVNQTRPPDSREAIPPTYVPPPSRPRPPPRRYRRRAPAWPSVLLLLGSALIIGSLLSGWWTMSVQEPNGGGTITYTFNPGSQFTVSCSGGTDCNNLPTGILDYSAHSLSSVGDLYGGALALELAALVFGILAAVAGLSGALGYATSRSQLLLGSLFALIALSLVLAAALSVIALQPSALTQGSGGIATAGSPSPSSSFWGSCSGGGPSAGACSTGPGSGTITADWGAGAGWYLSLAAAALLLFGFVSHTRGRPVRGAPM